MIKEEITKFMALAPLMLPKLLGDSSPEETDITDEYAILYYTLEEPFPIGFVMELLEDDMELALLYHGTDKNNSKVHHCCFFTSPKSGRNMFKFNLVSDNREMVSDLTISIYDSLDTMESELESDLAAHTDKFDFIQAMQNWDVLSHFCTLG